METVQNIHEIIRIIDINKYNITDKDYIDICNHLQKIYDYHNNEYDFDKEYSNNNSIFIMRLCIMFIIFQIMFYIIIQKST